MVDGKVVLTIKSENNNHLKKLSPELLLGCDGINSIVRTWLSKNEKIYNLNDSNKETRFDPVTVPSDAAGLNYKMLTLKDK